MLFGFEPRRKAIFLVAGDKSGNWDDWYRKVVPKPTGGLRSTWRSWKQHQMAEICITAGVTQAELPGATEAA